MKNCISRILCAAITAFVFAAAVSAQSDAIAAAAGDKYLISAKAGGVNFVQGPVAVVRTEGKSGQLLKGDKLDIGDRISTGADGRAEILLNPGSYLRLGGNSKFEFKTTSLDDLQVKLDSGSAIFEVFATKDFTVSVNTPKTKITLIDSGIYRVDVAADGSGKMAVWKGKAQVGDDENATVKSGREAALNDSQLAIAKFDRDEKDELDIWSKDRAKDLAKATGQLARNTMRSVLMDSFMGRGWNMYSSFGLWVFNPMTGRSCFLPFGWGWNSPYGYGFGSNIWYYNLPSSIIYYQPTIRNPSGGVTPGVTPPNTKTGNSVRTLEPVRPPFTQVQGSSGATGKDYSPIRPGRSVDVDGGGGFTPIRPAGGGFPSGGSSPAPAAAPSAPVKSSSPGRGRPID